MTTSEYRALRDKLKPFEQASSVRASLELALTTLPFAALWSALYICVHRGWWAGLLLAIPAAAFLLRLFMIQHDCGHQAFFRGRAANSWTGRACGVLTLTPYEYWRRTHAQHHATSGNLDRRELGGIETLTVSEYAALSPLRRLGYRLYRHPAILLGLGPSYMFLLQHRLPIGLMRQPWAWASVMGTNLSLAAVAGLFWLFGDPVAFLVTHVAVAVVAATAGVWLFFVQHQFEDAYWARNGAWTPYEAALRGSSHLRLPQPLRWLTAEIGAHHVHHAASRIPFYRLRQALQATPEFDQAPQLRMSQAFGAFHLALWDEPQRRLLSFRELSRRGASAS